MRLIKFQDSPHVFSLSTPPTFFEGVIYLKELTTFTSFIWFGFGTACHFLKAHLYRLTVLMDVLIDLSLGEKW